jgi:hypothetical protein
MVAIDDAGNYTAAWSGNGGSGFGAWSFSNTSENGGENGSFLATTGGNPDLSIATSEKGWGLYANSGQTANAFRSFTGESLGTGQSFIVRMDNGSVADGGVVGFGLQTSAGVNRFEFYFVGGQSNYKINVGGVETTTSVPFTSSGLTLEFQQTAANNFNFIINGGTPITGTLAASDIGQARFFDFNSGGGNNVYFNSMEVTPVPEPSNTALATFAGMVCAAAVFRRMRRTIPARPSTATESDHH